MTRPVAHHALVAAQLAGVAAAIVPWPPAAQSGVGWLAVAGAGIAFGVYTLCHNRIGNFSIYPEPRPHARLVTSGPYRFLRHPMYVALVLMLAGIAGYNGGVANVLGAALVAGVVVAKARLEERYLGTRFDGYDGYAARTARFIPFVW